MTWGQKRIPIKKKVAGENQINKRTNTSKKSLQVKKNFIMIITILHFKIKNISTSKAGKGINYLKPENIKVKKNVAILDQN